MLSEVMDHYGLLRDFMGQAAFFETDHARHMLKELKLAIKLGKLVVLSGIGGCGKTTMLRRVQESIEQEKEILVSKALSVEKSQIHLGGLIVALFADLATDKDVKIPTQPERRERALRDLVKKRQKPIALLIDDAHDLHPKTLLGLKRLIEVVRDSGGTLSVVLAGHPRLKNGLERPAMEEIGSRATIFELEGIRQEKPRYIEWLIKQCAAPKTADPQHLDGRRVSAPRGTADHAPPDRTALEPRPGRGLQSRPKAGERRAHRYRHCPGYR